MEPRGFKSLLKVAKVEQTKALVDQEGKLERQPRAKTTSNQNKSKHRENTERREGSKRVCDVNRDSRGKSVSIKIGVHNINRIKEDNTKVEQLAEYGKAEGYNIIGIVETNIGEQEGK